MNLLSELLAIEGKKPKCTCEKDEEACKMHAKVSEVKDFGHWMGDQGKKSPAPSSPTAVPTNHTSKTKYDDSADFTGDLFEAQQLMEKLLDIIGSDKFRDWIEATDKNFSTDCTDKLDEVLGNFHSMNEAFNDLGDELDKAQ